MATEQMRDELIGEIADVLVRAAPTLAAMDEVERAENEAYGAYARACHEQNMACVSFAAWREHRRWFRRREVRDAS